MRNKDIEKLIKTTIIKDNKFKLPNFPVKAIDVIIGEGEEE